MVQMVSRLQAKTGLGLSTTACQDFLNEAFRKMNQMQKGGFIWQFRGPTTIVTPTTDIPIALPADFDPGKTAVLRGAASQMPLTLIPYLPMKDFVNQQHFEIAPAGFFSSWTFVPSFQIPTSYPYFARLAPATAFDGLNQYNLSLWYHSLVQPPITYAANAYFPTPDQFDSLIVDLAVAEIRNVYRLSGSEQEMAGAMQAISEIIDTYRTDRYDLAGITDQVAQAQEKNAEKAK